MLTVLKVVGALLGATACLIPYLALTEEYERTNREEPQLARVLSIDGDVLRYEVHAPDSPWDDDGDGWVGPYSEDGIDEAELARLAPGSPLARRGGELELVRGPPSVLFLVGFGLCLLLALFWGLDPWWTRRKLRAAVADPLEVLRFMARRTRRVQASIGFILLACAGFIGFVAVAADGGAGERAFLIGLAALAGIAGLLPVLKAWRLRNIDRAPVLARIRQNPQSIVWIYEHVITVNNIPQYNLFVHASDGERFHFALSDVDPAPLVAALHALLPHAIIGYTDERLDRWKKDPSRFAQGEVASPPVVPVGTPTTF
ncbi:MAG: hypothetical protein AAGE52_37240 [Myxococcota bacterium]